MPLYRFIVHDGTGAPDPGPVQLRDDAVARSQSVLLAGEMLRDVDGTFWEQSHWCIEVTDHAGILISSIIIEGSAAPPAVG